jgi:tetratricopeptide (TPR) repeat protein
MRIMMLSVIGEKIESAPGRYVRQLTCPADSQLFVCQTASQPGESVGRKLRECCGSAESGYRCNEADSALGDAVSTGRRCSVSDSCHWLLSNFSADSRLRLTFLSVTADVFWRLHQGSKRRRMTPSGLIQERDQQIGLALQALRAGDTGQAEALIVALLSRLPNDPAAHQVAAVIALGKGDIATAAKHAITSLEARPQHAPTLLIAGRAARLGGDLAAADRFFSEALAVEPQRSEAAFMTCVIRLERGDSSARDLLDQLMARFPEEADGWFEIGVSLQRADKTEAALSAFARAHRRPDSHLRRGLILQQRSERDDAIAAYERAVTMDARLVEAWFRLGTLYQDQHQPDQATAAYRQALAQRPDLAEAEVNLGLLLQESGDRTGAYACYRRALASRPETFGRISQGITSGPHGELWLDLGKLRQFLQA